MAGRKVYWGTAEIARRLRVSRERAGQLVGRKDFPDPYQTLGQGRIWDSADVEAWIRVHRPHLVDPEDQV